MEGLFGERSIAEITGKDLRLPAYDPKGRLMLFPVRHHSPVCSWQLIRAINEFRPDVILIEGPENANELIPVLTDENTVMPCAVYYFYKDKKKLVNKEPRDYKCYYPFISSSPEYNAMAEGKRLGIETRFMDLPYSEILINTAENKGLRKEQDKHSYTDETRLTRSQFYARLCEKTGIRSFEEFWEKYFEIEGLKLTPEEFCKNMHTYCVLVRSEETAQELACDGTLARERHMAHRIREALDSGKRVLAVTGGLHSAGLAELLEKGDTAPVKLHKIPFDMEGCYPMAYSYEAADALHGYASGMSYPYFYDTITAKLKSGADTSAVYDEAALELLINTAKETAKRDVSVSIADVTAAKSMMTGLAALRNISQCGIYEVEDGITSSFIKGEKTIAAALPISVMHRLATGDSVGHIGDSRHTPPLIADFQKQCETFKLKYASVTPHEADVQLFSGEKGPALSRFFHRMEYLGTDFCNMLKGPDLHRSRDRSRVREQWRYRRTPKVDAVLIDHTTDGFTIEEACVNTAARALMYRRRSADAAQTAVDCFLMGVDMTDEQQRLIDAMIAADGDFFSLGEGLGCFARLHELRELYNISDNSSYGHMDSCMGKLMSALPAMANVPSENADDTVKVIRRMFSLTGGVMAHWRDTLEEELLTLTAARDKQAEVYGAAMGLLYAMDHSRRGETENAMRGYLKGSSEVRKQGAAFLKGLFSTAGDIMLADDSFIRMTDELLTSLSHLDFLEILPSMKLAFGYFTPSEIREIARSAAALHGADGTDITNAEMIDEGLFVYGRKLDEEIALNLKGGSRLG